jgi:hypothetical protein
MSFLDDDDRDYQEKCPLCGTTLPARKTEGRVFKCCYQRWTVENHQWVDFGMDYDEDE